MGRAREKPLIDAPSDIEADSHAWFFEQAELLRRRRFAELDLPNVIEELESMGRSQRAALRSSYRVLIAHLLKWQFQPSKRSTSWEVTILRERDNIEEREEESPSLRREAERLAREAYGKAVREASLETGLPAAAFPKSCPFDLAFLRDHGKLPD